MRRTRHPPARQPPITRATLRRGHVSERLLIATPFKVGKYLVTPYTRLIDDGRFAAVVSIRSGTGSMTHDRVLRFVPAFDTVPQATRFAIAQALAWIGQPERAAHRPTPSWPASESAARGKPITTPGVAVGDTLSDARLRPTRADGPPRRVDAGRRLRTNPAPAQPPGPVSPDRPAAGPAAGRVTARHLERPGPFPPSRGRTQ